VKRDRNLAQVVQQALGQPRGELPVEIGEPAVDPVVVRVNENADAPPGASLP
jgi:hypothetical protein